jgi:hypothetical protein
MSCLTNYQFEYLNNKNEKVYYNKGHGDEDFNFQVILIYLYISHLLY